MNTKCSFCGNKNFKEVSVQYIYSRDGKFLVVNDVPCEKCEFCGEEYYDGGVLEKIEEDFNQIYLSGKKVQNQISVPVEEFINL